MQVRPVHVKGPMKFLPNRAFRETNAHSGPPRTARRKAGILPNEGAKREAGSRGPRRMGDRDYREGSFEQFLHLHRIYREERLQCRRRGRGRNDVRKQSGSVTLMGGEGEMKEEVRRYLTTVIISV